MGEQRFETKPLYEQLRNALTERIAAGEWKAGTALPNEGELAREFSVSPGTMRKALDLLEGEHLLTRLQGRGTFVAINAQVSYPSASATYERQTANASRHLSAHRRSRWARPTKGSARVWNGQDEPVYRVRRVRTYADRPFIVEDAAMPAALFPGLTNENDPSHRIVVLARHHGVLLSRAEERVSLGSASPEVAKLLEIKPSTPIVVLDRVVRAIDGRPVEWRIGHCDLGELSYLAEMN